MKLKKQIVIPFTIIGLIILIPIYSLIINYFKSASTLSLKSSFKEINLVSHQGKFVDFRDFKDIPTLLFFGFTHCPEVCPTTLSNLLNNIEALEKKDLDYKILFITLDPDRDTVANLKNYLVNFNESVIGLTGDIKEISKFAKKWNIYWEKINEGDDYLINHTATVFLINKEGNFYGTIAWGESEKSIQLKLKKLFNL